METVRISSKYQVVIPKAVREELQWQPGLRVSVLAKGGNLEVVPMLPFEQSRGMFKGARNSEHRDRTDRY